MPKRKLTARYEPTHQVFTRATDRVYTHVVIGRTDRARTEAVAVARAEHYTKQTYAEIAALPPRNMDLQSERNIARIKEQAAHSLDEALARAKRLALEKVAESASTRAYDDYEPICWCGRPDLAQKQAENAMKSPHLCLNDVQIVAVEGAAA